MVGIIADLLSIGGTIATVYGIGATVTGNSTNFAVSLDETPFAIRLILVIIVASALGWGLGSATLRLTKARKEALIIVSYIMSIVWAALLIASVEIISDDSSDTGWLHFPLFSFVGLCLVLWIARFQYRVGAGFDGLAAVHFRSIGLLIFAITTTLLVFLVEIT